MGNGGPPGQGKLPLLGKKLRVWLKGSTDPMEIIKLGNFGVSPNGTLVTYTPQGIIKDMFAPGSWERMQVDDDPDNPRGNILVPRLEVKPAPARA